MVDNSRHADDALGALGRIDEEILDALDRRALASRELHRALAAGHDASKLAALEARAMAMPVEDVRLIFSRIYAACEALGGPLVVAYVGPAGGGGFAAARARFGGAAELLVTDSAQAAIAEVSRGRAAFAVVPLETLGDGPVKATLTALIESDLRIAFVAEISHDLHLLARPGRTGPLARIYATTADHALAEVALLAAGVPVVDVASPLVACELAAAEDGAAALGCEAAGCERGLAVVGRGLSTRSPDRVRYAMVSMRGAARTGDDATSCVFGVHDEPGALLGVLAVFAERGVNLTRIHSRPAPSLTASSEPHDWSYLFFIEVAGHASDRALVTALEEVRRKARFFKVLGSYRAPR